MPDQSVRPVVEEVLAVGLELVSGDDRRPAPRRRRTGLAATRRRPVLPRRIFEVIDGNSVKRVTLGHAGCDVTGTVGSIVKLHLDDNELSTCVACGLCLPHCPTFRVTGEEGLSPRGRISAMRSVHFDDAPVTDDFVHFMETCVQCRGCEPACPSGVPFGRLMEGTRDTLTEQHRMTPWWQSAGYRVLGHHRLLLVGSTLLAFGATTAVGAQAPWVCRQLALRRGACRPSTGNDAWLFTGCVMDAWQRETHRNTAKVLSAVGVAYRTPEAGGACCGALHIHAGLTDEARGLAERVMRSMPGDAPIVVNSAGCGAALKDYGHLLDTEEARRVQRSCPRRQRVRRSLVDALQVRRRLGPVTVQDPCHLRHVQRAHLAGAHRAGCRRRRRRARRRRAVLRRRRRVLDAATGARRRDPRAQVGCDRTRRRRTSSPVPIPGCALHLAAAGVHVEHPDGSSSPRRCDGRKLRRSCRPAADRCRRSRSDHASTNFAKRRRNDRADRRTTSG